MKESPDCRQNLGGTLGASCSPKDTFSVCSMDCEDLRTTWLVLGVTVVGEGRICPYGCRCPYDCDCPYMPELRMEGGAFVVVQ